MQPFDQRIRDLPGAVLAVLDTLFVVVCSGSIATTRSSACGPRSFLLTVMTPFWSGTRFGSTMQVAEPIAQPLN